MVIKRGGILLIAWEPPAAPSVPSGRTALRGFGVSDPLVAVLLVEAGEVKPFQFGPNHDNFAGEF